MQYVFLVAGAALIAWSWWMVRRGYLAGLESLEQGRRELEAVVEELVSVAEEVTGEVKDRQARLQDLCHQADLRIARLGGVSEAGAPEEVKLEPPARRRRLTLATGAPAPQAVRPMEAVPLPPSGGAPAETQPHADVWRLAEEGMELTEIARLTNKTKGEVQLILGLRKLGQGAG